MSDPSNDPSPPQPKPPENSPPAPLNYISPRDDPSRAAKESERARLGALLTAGSIFLVVFHWLVPPAMDIGKWISTALAVGIVAGTASFQYTRYNSTAFAKGVLIGIGIGVLVEGLCFMIFLPK